MIALGTKGRNSIGSKNMSKSNWDFQSSNLKEPPKHTLDSFQRRLLFNEKHRPSKLNLLQISLIILKTTISS